MKYGIVVLLFVCMGGLVLVSGTIKTHHPPDGGELSWKSYGAGLVQAKQENKKVLVDVFTTWCGWCKKMDRDVYADADVKTYLGTNFVVVKLNAESLKEYKIDSVTATEAQIARAYGITGYPATIFLTDEGKAITVVSGYIEVKRFMTILKYINEDKYKTTSWDDYLAQQG